MKSTSIIAIAMLTLILMAGTGSAASGDGTMKVNPSSVTAGIDNDFIFTFNNQAHTFIPGSQATITVPSSWTAPQETDSNGKGYVSGTAIGAPTFSYSVSGQTITVNFETNKDNNKGFTISYKKATAPSGSYKFTTKTKNGYAGSLKNIRTQPTIKVSPASGILVVSGFPSTTLAGNIGSFTVKAIDANGNIAVGYTGKVHFTSSDKMAELPEDHKFNTKDKGIHTFSARLKTLGTQWIKATDRAKSSITGSQTDIQVNTPEYTHTLTPSPKVGDKVKDTVTSTSTSGNKMQFKWLRPNGQTARTKYVTRSTNYIDSFKPDIEGSWGINVKEFDSKGAQLGTSSTSFTATVNPEFGKLGAVLPLFAVSFIFMNFRKRFNK